MCKSIFLHGDYPVGFRGEQQDNRHAKYKTPYRTHKLQAKYIEDLDGGLLFFGRHGHSVKPDGFSGNGIHYDYHFLISRVVGYMWSCKQKWYQSSEGNPGDRPMRAVSVASSRLLLRSCPIMQCASRRAARYSSLMLSAPVVWAVRMPQMSFLVLERALARQVTWRSMDSRDDLMQSEADRASRSSSGV